MLLIDTLYDAKVRLVATSDQPAEGIYPAGDHAFEFGRTVSRLKENAVRKLVGEEDRRRREEAGSRLSPG